MKKAASKRAIFKCSHSNMDKHNTLSSRLKVADFRVKSHLEFHWFLYKKALFAS